MLKRLASFVAVVVFSSVFVVADDKPKTPQAPQKEQAAPAPTKVFEKKPEPKPEAKNEVKPEFKKVDVKPEVKKVEVKPTIKVEVKATVKQETKPAATAAAWIPRELHGTPTAKRLTDLQAQIDAANAKRGPARAEADKARTAFNDAQRKFEDLDHTIKALEQDKIRTIHNGLAQQKEWAQHKATWENAQKVQKLEKQVQDLTARLEASLKQAAAQAESCRTKDQKPAAPPKK
jgi:hypothetical protein